MACDVVLMPFVHSAAGALASRGQGACVLGWRARVSLGAPLRGQAGISLGPQLALLLLTQSQAGLLLMQDAGATWT